MALTRQLEEIHLLQCSLLPGELLTFLDDVEAWSSLLAAYPDTTNTPSISEARFEVKLNNAHLWFEVRLPHLYPGGAQPLVSVKGETIARDEQRRWQVTVGDKIQELDGCEYVNFR